MKNRTVSTPILCAILLSLTIGVGFAATTEQGDVNPAPSALEAVPAPPEPTTAPTAATTPPVKSAPTAAPAAAAKHTTSYTVVAGDSLTTIAQKFNSTRKKLKALNNLTSSTVKPGQVLLVPATKSPDVAAKPSKAKSHHTYLAAQPVQDFDIPASTFASCPVPLPSPDEDADSGDSSTPTTSEKPVPIAKLVSPAEMAAEQKRQSVAAATVTEPVMPPEPAPSGLVRHDTPFETGPAPSGLVRHNFQSETEPSTDNAYTATLNPPPPKLIDRIFNSFSNQKTAAADWGNRFLQQARALGNEGIEYDEDWRPPGESRSWTMDCSNTSRYLYKVTAGIDLPRTASDQYYYLHLQGKAWDVPQVANGLPDTEFLRQNLKPGDLLFWENTYRPERQPPITHVMVYLGTNQKGQWLMAGSQSSRGGEHDRRNGGPDIYVFRPCQPCGGYTTWMGLVHHTGRFCAFGRPLEADRSKLSVAENTNSSPKAF